MSYNEYLSSLIFNRKNFDHSSKTSLNPILCPYLNYSNDNLSVEYIEKLISYHFVRIKIILIK